MYSGGAKLMDGPCKLNFPLGTINKYEYEAMSRKSKGFRKKSYFFSTTTPGIGSQCSSSSTFMLSIWYHSGIQTFHAKFFCENLFLTVGTVQDFPVVL